MSTEHELLIEKYFENSLTEAEKTQFEILVNSNTEFRDAVGFEKNLKSAIHKKERYELKNQLKSFEKKQETKIVAMPRWLWLAAASVIIVGATLWIFVFKTSSNEDLFTQNFQVYPNVIAPSVRGSSTVEGDKKLAFELYEQEKFREAIGVFEKISKETKDEYPVFYVGQCYMALGEYQKAISILSGAVLTDEKFPFDTQRKWYLALAYLKMGDKENAKLILELLTNYENIQNQKATELLEKLEK
ncbi:MAG: tetratricopeptide repeat protein [Spirosomaceae bacterium]|nr:tetratricopeptide repeat protein [Spirosomataceae bacterium]